MNKRWIKAAIKVMALEAEWVYSVHKVTVIIITFWLCYCHLIWHSTMNTLAKAFRGNKLIRSEAKQRQVWVDRTGRPVVTLPSLCVFICSGKPTCRCPVGFSGPFCERRICENYCLNGGTCEVTKGNQPVCRCLAEYTGERCLYRESRSH